MKPLYRTAFQLERVGDRLNSVHEISQACLDWVFMYKGVPRKGIVRRVSQELSSSSSHVMGRV